MHLVFDRISDHLSHSISKTQFGFRKGHSTAQQLLLFVSHIMASLDDKKYVDAVYLDFRKAFDSVLHAELLGKLEQYGISGVGSEAI